MVQMVHKEKLEPQEQQVQLEWTERMVLKEIQEHKG